MENLEGKTAFISGASQGIGRACALALAKMGAHGLHCGHVMRPTWKQWLKKLPAAEARPSPSLWTFPTKPQIQAAAKAAIAHFGSVDILVNNAGITRDTLLLRMKRADCGCGDEPT